MLTHQVKEAVAKVDGQVKEVFTFDKCEGATPFASLLEHGLHIFASKPRIHFFFRRGFPSSKN